MPTPETSIEVLIKQNSNIIVIKGCKASDNGHEMLNNYVSHDLGTTESVLEGLWFMGCYLVSKYYNFDMITLLRFFAISYKKYENECKVNNKKSIKYDLQTLDVRTYPLYQNIWTILFVIFTPYAVSYTLG